MDEDEVITVTLQIEVNVPTSMGTDAVKRELTRRINSSTENDVLVTDVY